MEPDKPQLLSADRTRVNERLYDLILKRWTLLDQADVMPLEEAIEADLRAMSGQPLLYKHDPRTRIKLGG